MMELEAIHALYDRLLPGWRTAPLSAGERLLKCPLHEDSHPSLRLNTDKLTWSCDLCAVRGGGHDLVWRGWGQHIVFPAGAAG